MSNIQPKDKSQAQFFREGGYESMKHFMLAHQLKLHNDDDVEEANAIIKAMRDADQKAWEEENKGKK